MIRPQELGNILEDNLSINWLITDNDCVIIRPGTPRDIKKWVKKNGNRTGQTNRGAFPIYQLNYIPMCLRKRDRREVGGNGMILVSTGDGNLEWIEQ